MYIMSQGGKAQLCGFIYLCIYLSYCLALKHAAPEVPLWHPLPWHILGYFSDPADLSYPCVFSDPMVPIVGTGTAVSCWTASLTTGGMFPRRAPSALLFY